MKKNPRKVYKSNKNGATITAALILIALCQIPIAIKNSAKVFFIGKTSNTIWRNQKNHPQAYMIAVNRCNGSIID
tara:strand:- start:1212 stop:1436 length:225 start_codon:yes stop_codon:yes gene_type:complete